MQVQHTCFLDHSDLYNTIRRYEVLSVLSECPHICRAFPDVGKVIIFVVMDSICYHAKSIETYNCSKVEDEYLYCIVSVAATNSSSPRKPSSKPRSIKFLLTSLQADRLIFEEGELKEGSNVLDLSQRPAYVFPGYEKGVAQQEDFRRVKVVKFPTDILVRAPVEITATVTKKIYKDPELKNFHEDYPQRPEATISVAIPPSTIQKVSERKVLLQIKEKELNVAKVETVNIFVSYAREDGEYLVKLKNHLASLTRSGKVKIWYDRLIVPGAEWEEDIAKNLNDSHIILLLVSPNFIASDFIYNEELNVAMTKHESGLGKVIPIIVRSVDWHGEVYSKLNALPSGTIPISLWKNEDEALLDVALGIRRAVEQITME